MKKCVVIDAVRTPIGRSGWNGMKKGGQFAQVSAQVLLGSAVSELVRQVKSKSNVFDPKE